MDEFKEKLIQLMKEFEVTVDLDQQYGGNTSFPFYYFINKSGEELELDDLET